MKSAEDGRRYDAPHVLDGAMDRCVLIERPMSPQLVAAYFVRMRRECASPKTINHMVDALAPDRSDQPFGEAVLPRRAEAMDFLL
jgi:hypothetical protein